MKIYRFLWLLLLAVSSFAQTHTEMTLEDVQTATAAKTFPQINKTCYADAQAGATADIKINACLTILGSGGGATGGGIVNATGFGASVQTIASTVTIPRFVTLLFSPTTFVQAGSSSTNLFVVKPDAVLDGLTFDCANQPSYSGTVIANDGVSTYGSDTTPSASSTAVRNVQSTHACQSVATGTFISLNAPVAGTYVFNFLIQNATANGLLNGLLLQSAGASGASFGWINGIRVVNFLGYQNINCIHFTTGTNGQLNSNIFYYSCEAGGTGTNGVSPSVPLYGIKFDGSTGTSVATGNIFIGDLWDYHVGSNVPIAQGTTASRANYFLGEIDGTPTDVNSGNYWLVEPNLNIFKASSVTATFGTYTSPITLNSSSGVVNLDSSGNNYVQTDGANSVYIKNNGGNTYFYSGGGAGTQVGTINSSGLFSKYGALSTTGNGLESVQASPSAITIGSGTSIAATSLCSTTQCPAGIYQVHVYVDVTTACSTTGSYIVWIGYTDDAGAKTGSSTTTFIPINGNGVTQATGSLALASTANYGQGIAMVKTTGAATGGLGSINYGTTATACGTGGPMVGKMYLDVTRLDSN